ncbi:hypothetical protein P4C99_04145, partial [Pontiellaceae bacterium B1224]|nr:hypothetical protein [Pontiellaceae bacterium B1224]
HHTINDDSSLMWYLKVIEGTTTNEYSRGSVWNDTTAGYENDPEGVATVTLTGLTELTDTTVTFIWGFSGQRGHNLENQSNWMDDIVLSGTSSAIEPVVSAILSAGSLSLSWAGGGSYNVLTNANLMIPDGWGVATSGTSPVELGIDSEPGLFYKLESE